MIQRLERLQRGGGLEVREPATGIHRQIVLRIFHRDAERLASTHGSDMTVTQSMPNSSAQRIIAAVLTR